MTVVRHQIGSALGKLVMNVTSARTNCPFVLSSLTPLQEKE